MNKTKLPIVDKCSKFIYVGLLILMLTSVSTDQVHAQCDGCVVSAVGASATSITSALAQLQIAVVEQLFQIGHAIGSLLTANTASLQGLTKTNEKGFALLVDEAHIRASKKSSLEVKRDINTSFGAISTDHCYAVETTMGVTNSDSNDYQQALFSAKNFASEVKANTKSPALRRRIMEEYLPKGIDLARYFSSRKILTEDEMLHVPALTHVLSQSVVFPVAPVREAGKENDLSRYYRELKRERDAHGAIVEDTLARSILSNAPVVEAGDYVRRTLVDAGIEPGQYVQGDFTSETSLIKAIGHSSFGNLAAVRHSGLSGEELMRVLISEVGKTNYVLSKQYETLKDIRFLQTLSFGKEVEHFYATRLEQAFQKMH